MGSVAVLIGALTDWWVTCLEEKSSSCWSTSCSYMYLNSIDPVELLCFWALFLTLLNINYEHIFLTLLFELLHNRVRRICKHCKVSENNIRLKVCNLDFVRVTSNGTTLWDCGLISDAFRSRDHFSASHCSPISHLYLLHQLASIHHPFLLNFYFIALIYKSTEWYDCSVDVLMFH